MRLLTRASVLLVFPALVAGCHHPQASDPADTRAASAGQPARRSRDLITTDEIRSKQWSTVYDMIAELRPAWLRERGPDTMHAAENMLMVHLNGARVGDVNSLYQMPIVGINFIQYYSPNEAAARWGFGYNHGAVDIITERR